MPDNLQNRGQPDRSKINMNEDYEVRYWTKHLGVSKEKLAQAVEKGGQLRCRCPKRTCRLAQL